MGVGPAVGVSQPGEGRGRDGIWTLKVVEKKPSLAVWHVEAGGKGNLERAQHESKGNQVGL